MGSARSEEDKQREREGGTAVDARARPWIEKQRAVSFCVYGSGRRARAVSEVGCWLACLSGWSLREIASAGRCFWSASSRLEMPTTGELWQGNRDPDTRLALAPISHRGDGRRCPCGVGGSPPDSSRRGAAADVNPEADAGTVRVRPYGGMEQAISSASCCLTWGRTRRALTHVQRREPCETVAATPPERESGARRREQRQAPAPSSRDKTQERRKERRRRKGNGSF